jgi:tetratricopeptide (TPR) repeat protein
MLLEYVLGDDVSPRLARLIAALTGADPSDRPESASDALVLAATSRPIERRVARPDTPRPMPAGRRTPPLEEVPPAPPAGPPQWSLSPPSRRSRLIAVVPLCLALVALAAVLLFADGGQEAPPATEAARDSGSRPQEGEPAPPASPIPEPREGTDLTRAIELNDQGFALIGAGDYETAVNVLRQSLTYFPPDTDDINYAYALYNFGHALRLSGRPEEAVPVLERRLEIPDQTETVAEELALAREEAEGG